MYLYKITNSINNKTYFGITGDIQDRFDYHRTRAFQPKHKEYDKVLYRAFRKYGIENFTFEILSEDLSIEKAKELEIEYIKKFNSTSHDLGYNVTRGGDFTAVTGEDHHNAILTEEEAKDIINRRLNKEKRSDVYAIYSSKITFAGFCNVWQGRTWSHINPEFSNRQDKGRDGVKNGNSIFTKEDVIWIRTKRKESYSRIVIFREFNKDVDRCSEAAFNRVWYNYTYKNIIV